MTDLFSLTGKVALVTGGSRGIGLMIARGYVEAGVRVYISSRKAEVCEEIAAELSTIGFCVALPADLSTEAECQRLAAELAAREDRLDILVNNAGIQHVAPVEDFPIEKWDQIIAINMTSAFHSTRAAVPIMKAQGRGRIVNIASAHALVASPFKSAYVTAKHGVLGLTKTVALEVAEHGITCTAICPGYVKTPLVEAQIADQAKARGITEERVMKDVILAAQPTKKFVEFSQLAGMLLYLVSDAGASVNGVALSIDGGWTAA